jgi:hypothetical protein
MTRSMTLPLAFASVFAVGLTAAVYAAAPPADTSYSIKGSYYETCACSVSCPCASNATLPTEGHCDGVSLVHIDKGTYGPVKLDGLNLAIVLRSPKGQKVKDSFEKGEMDLFTLYLDDKANAQQKEVMPKLIASLFGTGEIKGSKPPQWVPMNLTTDGDTAKFTIAGGSKLSFETENIDVADKTKLGYKKGDMNNRIVLTNTAPFPWVHDITQGISRQFKYADLGTSWEYKERNAFFGAVDASGK